MNVLRQVIFKSTCLALLAWLTGCGSPLVGLECRDGFERCGGGCYELASDHDHCGGCGIVCSSSQQCVLSMCVASGDGGDGGGDGGDGDGGGDAARDGGGDGSADAGRDGDIDANLDAGDGNGLDGSSGMDGSSDARIGDADARTGDATPGLPDGSILLPDGAVLLPDGAIIHPGVDDGGVDDGSAGDSGGTVVPPPLCTGPGSPVDCVCDLGTTKCGLLCVNTNTDHDNCGGCVPATPPQIPGVMCQPEEYCNDGRCALICTPPLTLCDGLCVDTLSDDAHCGTLGCGLACSAAAACIFGECVGRAVGHIVVIGHDMTVVTRPIRQLVGNTVFLAPRTPVRVLAYDEATSVASRAGVRAAIEQSSIPIGRAYTFTTASADNVTQELGDADVFVIEVQQAATDAALLNLGITWSAALQSFLLRGGVILLFDGGVGANAGTFQILKAATGSNPTAPLFDATSRVDIPQRILALKLENASDAIAAGVSTQYQSQGGTAGFVINPMALNPGTVVVHDPPALSGVQAPTTPPNLPVVIHAVVTLGSGP